MAAAEGETRKISGFEKTKAIVAEARKLGERLARLRDLLRLGR